MAKEKNVAFFWLGFGQKEQTPEKRQKFRMNNRL